MLRSTEKHSPISGPPDLAANVRAITASGYGSYLNRGGAITSIYVRTAGLLLLSNLFMTFAWYAHLRNLAGRPWYIAAAVSWGIALFEYLFQVPANRIGYSAMSLAQLKILQEVITLLVFAPFAVGYMRQPLKLDYLWAALCLVGAVYFVFRSPGT